MLNRITLHLARNAEFPEGSVAHGYDIIAPLDGTQHIDVEEWKRRRHQCHIRRFWGKAPDRFGMLVHQAGGPNGATWLFDYDRAITADDEAAYRLDRHVFKLGEYVSIKTDGGESHTFKVIRITQDGAGE